MVPKEKVRTKMFSRQEFKISIIFNKLHSELIKLFFLLQAVAVVIF